MTMPYPRRDKRKGHDPKVDGGLKKKKKTTQLAEPHPNTQKQLSPAAAAAEPTLVDQPTNPIPSPDLSTLYDITTITIAPGSAIQQRTTRTLSHLSTYPPPTGTKPSLVVLRTSRASAACKLITITEIAKREIARAGGKWFQYSGVESGVVVRKEDKKEMMIEGVGEGVREEVVDEVDEDEDGEEDFETMKTPFERAIEGVPKVRKVSSMVVYLSRQRIESLKKIYGEQTNALEGVK